MITFVHDDAGYLAWVNDPAHATGYVVNAYAEPTPAYLVMHRATCGTVTGRPSRGGAWTSSEYSKTCSLDVKELEAWARDAVGKRDAPMHRCGLCKP